MSSSLIQLKKHWKRYRRALKRCQQSFSEKAIHASRVETRRLLATIELLAGFLPAARVRKLRRALKRHLDTFDDLRDTQVQLQILARMRSRHSRLGGWFELSYHLVYRLVYGRAE